MKAGSAIYYIKSDKKSNLADILQGNKEVKLSAIENFSEENINKIIDESRKTNLAPILNFDIDFPISEEELTSIKKAGIKLSMNATNYNEETFKSSKLDSIDHIFFTKEEDMWKTINKNLLGKEKTSSIQLIDEGLKIADPKEKDPNILIYGEVPAKEELDKLLAISERLEEMGSKASKITIGVTNPNVNSINEITNIFCTKFQITDENQQIGIKLEIEDILKDKVNGHKKLDEYQKLLSEQFKKDKAEHKVNNKLNIYFDVSDPNFRDIYTEVKYVISDDSIISEKEIFNSCIKIEKSDVMDKAILQTERNYGYTKPNIEAYNKVIKHNFIENIKNIALGEEKILNGADKLKADKQYLYEDIDIQDILACHVSSDKFSVRVVNKYNLKDNLSGTVDDLKKGKEAVLIAINTGDHWISMSVAKDPTNGIIVTYNDPKGTELYVRDWLTKPINDILKPNEIRDLATIQQGNDNNCGAFVTDNLIKFAEKKNVLKPQDPSKGIEGQKLRDEHSKDLKEIRLIKHELRLNNNHDLSEMKNIQYQKHNQQQKHR